MHSRLTDCVCRWPLAWVVGGILLAVVSSFYTVRRLEFKTSQNDLISRNSQYWRLYSEYAREFRSEEDYIIVVESNDPARNRAAVDALVSGLLAPTNNPATGESPLAQRFLAEDLFYRVDLSAFQRWFLYYLSMEDLNCLKDFPQLVFILHHQPNIAGFLRVANESLVQIDLAGPERAKCTLGFVPMMTTVVQQVGDLALAGGSNEWHSPWMQAFVGPGNAQQAEEQMKWQGYQTFRQGRMFLLLVHPRLGTETAEAHHAATIPKLRRIMEEAREQFPTTRINLTGEPVLDYDEMLQSQSDATKATALTFILVCLLFVAGFRTVLRPLMGVLCMILVLAVCMGYTTLTIGHLNMITVTFAVMILGLGIDLGIQFIARFEEELSQGATRADAVRGAIRHTGPSIVTAGVTNAAAFFAMGLSGFRGVIELGVIAGGGMLIATAGTMTVLPSLLLLVHRKHEARQIRAQAVATRIERLLLRRPYLMLALFGVITLAALAAAPTARFDYNVLNLQSKGLPSVETELRLLHADVESTLFAAVVCDNLQQTRDLQDRLSKLPSVASVHSIAEMIPEDQEPKVKSIQEIRQALGSVHFDVVPDDPGEIVNGLKSLRLRATALARKAGDSGDKSSLEALTPLTNALTHALATVGANSIRDASPSEFQQRLADYERHFYADLESQLAIIADQSDHPMTIEDVPAGVRQIFVGKTGKFLVEVFPRENIWERGPLVRFVREVQSVAPKATGTPMGLYEFVEILKTGYCRAALWALLVIAILIFIDFRGGYATLLTILPLLVGTAWMFGAMVLFRINFNPANIMVLPLIVGIGVAYGIYVVQRYRESHEATFYSRSTGRAVILSAMMTTFAFASLLIGAHRGIRSLGLVTTLGVISCLLAALVLLPSLLEIARRKRWKV